MIFVLGTDFGRFTISSFLVVANLLFHGGFVLTSVGHRTDGKLPYQVFFMLLSTFYMSWGN